MEAFFGLTLSFCQIWGWDGYTKQELVRIWYSHLSIYNWACSGFKFENVSIINVNFEKTFFKFK